MKHVAIEIVPLYETSPEDFRAKVRAAATQRKPAAVYHFTTFSLDYKDSGELKTIRATVRGLNAKLPPAFASGKVDVFRVTLRCPVPASGRVTAKPGWYVGENFNLPGAEGCCIDPKGKRTGAPLIMATGTSFDDVLGLYKLVMTGRLKPGYNGDPWHGGIFASR